MKLYISDMHIYDELPTTKISHLFTFVIFLTRVNREPKIDHSLAINTHVTLIVFYAYSVYNPTSVSSISEVSFIIPQSRRNLNRITLLDGQNYPRIVHRETLHSSYASDIHASLINCRLQSTVRTDTKSIALASLSICLTKEGSQRRTSRGTNDATRYLNRINSNRNGMQRGCGVRAQAAR